MAYRDDKEAAFARADALQRELDRTQAELEQTKGKLADSERARDSLAQKLLHKVPAPEPVYAPPPRRGGGAALGGLAVIGAMSAFAISNGHHYSPPPPHIEIPKFELQHIEMPKIDIPQLDATFTIDSQPTGANIYEIEGGKKRFIGTTPLSRNVFEWSLSATGDGASYVIEAPGYYRKLIEDRPWDAPATHAQTYTLDRKK